MREERWICSLKRESTRSRQSGVLAGAGENELHGVEFFRVLFKPGVSMFAK